MSGEFRALKVNKFLDRSLVALGNFQSDFILSLQTHKGYQKKTHCETLDRMLLLQYGSLMQLLQCVRKRETVWRGGMRSCKRFVCVVSSQLVLLMRRLIAWADHMTLGAELGKKTERSSHIELLAVMNQMIKNDFLFVILENDMISYILRVICNIS